MITKVSEIKLKNILNFLHITETEITDEEKFFLTTAINIARSFIKGYTGVEDADMDKYTDFIIAVYILVSDMNENRTLVVDKNTINWTVKTILDLHSVNLL